MLSDHALELAAYFSKADKIADKIPAGASRLIMLLFWLSSVKMYAIYAELGVGSKDHRGTGGTFQWL